MQDHISISPYPYGQEKLISSLVRKIYTKYVAPDYSQSGNESFYDWIEPEKIRERQLNELTIWIAQEDSDIVGMIEIRDNCHISLLFVDERFHGRGIAKLLLQRVKKEILSRNPDTREISVHASPYSIPIYRKMGFIETGEMREENGIIYLPMILRIQ